MLEKLVAEYRQTIEEATAVAERKRAREMKAERIKWEKAIGLAWQNWGLDTLIGPACYLPNDEGGRHPALIGSTTVDGVQVDVTLRHETTTGDRAYVRLYVRLGAYENTNGFAICDNGAPLATSGDLVGWLVERIFRLLSAHAADQAEHAQRLRTVATIRRLATAYAEEKTAYDQACHTLATAITMEHWQPCPLWLIRYVPLSIGSTEGTADDCVKELVVLNDPEEIASWLRQGRLVGVTTVSIDGYTGMVMLPSLVDAKRIDVQPPGITAWMPYWRTYRYGNCYARVPPTTPETWRFPAAPEAPKLPYTWLGDYVQHSDHDDVLIDLEVMTDEEFVARYGAQIRVGGGDAVLQPE